MDTQIGTRPQIGALEIHQAYILASLNWLQQTRNLAQLVKSKPVCDVFVSKVVKLGTDKNNVWSETQSEHLA